MHASFAGFLKTFFLEFVCPEDALFAIWDILEHGAMTPAIETVDLVALETGETIAFTSNVTVERRVRGWALSFRPVYDANDPSGANVLNAIDFVFEECPGCQGGLGLSLLTVGGDPLVLPLVVNTDDRFNSVSTATTGAIGDVAYSSYVDGALQLVCVGDDPDPASATSAIVYRSIDGGTNFVALTDIDIIVYKFVNVDGNILAVGVTAGGAAAVQLSTNGGGAFVDLPNATLPAAEALVSADYDPKTLKLYFGGASGSLFTGRLGTTGLSLVDITATIVALPTLATVNAIVVVDKGDIVIAGDSGIVKESRDSALTWEVVAFPTSDDIVAMAGNKYRLVLGATINVYERTFLTKNAIKAAPLADSAVLAGNITDIAMNTEDDFNRFAVCTDLAEVAMGLPNYPNA
jgi:hypothetical protein